MSTRTDDVRASAARHGRLADAALDTSTMLWRDMLRTTRQPEMLVFAVVMGVFFLVLFNYVFGGAIGAGADVDYLQFLVPGVFVITALQGAQQTSMGFAADLAEGVTDRFRSLPMSQVAVIAGRTIADAVRNVIGLALVAVLALIMGYRFDSAAGAVAAIALATLDRRLRQEGKRRPLDDDDLHRPRARWYRGLARGRRRTQGALSQWIWATVGRHQPKSRT